MSHRFDEPERDRDGGRRGPGGAVSASGGRRRAEEEPHAADAEAREGPPAAPAGPSARSGASAAERSPAARDRTQEARPAQPAASAGGHQREGYVDERGPSRERSVDEGGHDGRAPARDTRGPASDREHGGHVTGRPAEPHDERGGHAGSGGNTPAILALVLGIAAVASLVVSLGALFFLALPLGIAAIVFGFKGKRRAEHGPGGGRHRTAAKVGLGLGAVGSGVSLLAILLLLLGVSLLGGAMGGLNREVDEQAQQEQQGQTQRQRDELARRGNRQREELARRAARQREELRSR